MPKLHKHEPIGENAKKQTPRQASGVGQGPVAQVEEPDLLAMQRALVDPATAPPAGILALQRMVGNRAVAGLLTGVGQSGGTHQIIQREDLPSNAETSRTKGNYALDPTDRRQLYMKNGATEPWPADKITPVATQAQTGGYTKYKCVELPPKMKSDQNDCKKFAAWLQGKEEAKSLIQVAISEAKEPELGRSYIWAPPQFAQAWRKTMKSSSIPKEKHPAGTEVAEKEGITLGVNRDKVFKALTQSHVTTVVAKDTNSVVTLEVNAAYQDTGPWFTIHEDKRKFYNAFKDEYTTARSSEPKFQWMFPTVRGTVTGVEFSEASPS